jgi:hypothetical protein
MLMRCARRQFPKTQPLQSDCILRTSIALLESFEVATKTVPLEYCMPDMALEYPTQEPMYSIDDSLSVEPLQLAVQ